jgi:hypothetical protein
MRIADCRLLSNAPFVAVAEQGAYEQTSPVLRQPCPSKENWSCEQLGSVGLPMKFDGGRWLAASGRFLDGWARGWSRNQIIGAAKGRSF